ncbi:MAG: D-glycero-beta-D-manno-heptose-7-phosphate kinase [Deltaproteobacteria bacterium]|nr:D-glycero-beta-D-manno-heptose-7-phosphate kinase [Deltaproteobacteria bacterium]
MYLSSILENFPKLRILVIGDVMLDRYFWGDVQRISPEAPVPILKVSGENLSLGGAANVAKNLRSLGATVEIFGIIGRDGEGENLIALLKQIQIDSKGIISDLKNLTATKTRLIAENQQIARIDKEETSPISDKVKNHIMRAFTKSVEENTPHGIIISDYAKGLIREDLSNEIIQLARRKGIFVCIDPKGKDFNKYKGANVITPNQKETEELCGFPIEDDKTLKRAAEILIEQTDAEGVLITRGRHGISFYVKGTHEIKTIHSDAREVFDVTGAGDTVVSAFTLSYITSKSWEDSVRIANCAAGIVVGRIGTATVTQQELSERFNYSQYLSNNKILTRDLLSKTVFRLKEEGKRIVFTNGCFDLFHIGHLKLLKQAKEMGDVLVVGINSEDSAKRLKGEGRPFIGENDRVNIIAALDCVDYVVVFEEDTPLDLIKVLKPDLIVKGGDYSLDTVVGKNFVESYGGKVFIIPLVEGVSTSLLVDKIRNGI